MSAIFVPMDTSVMCVCVFISVCVCVCEGKGATVCSSLQKQRNVTKVRWWEVGVVGLSWVQQQQQEEVEKKVYKYIWNSILCRIFIGLWCHWSHALRRPCSAHYHVIIIHRLVMMTRGWFDCFFMWSAFFAINAFVLKLNSLVIIGLNGNSKVAPIG